MNRAEQSVDIVLATLNAKYIHSSFGLRYLYANMGELQSKCKISEFNINQRALDIAEDILKLNPGIIAFGIYIWNVTQSLEVIKLLKTIKPEAVIIVGGPEVSYESRLQEIVQLADCCITGEADLIFPQVCKNILDGQELKEKIIASPLPKTEELKLPYDFYTANDIDNRVIYVEASRGCPFSCEFCLSSLDIPVRQFDLEAFLAEMDKLFARGSRHFKFVDRTFNLNLKTGKAILQFFLDRYEPGMFVHFEMIPDRLPEGLRQIIKLFPAGALQFEVGIQSFNPEVNKLISRRQDFEKIAENLKYLRQETGVHIHADLIAGLPGESLESFAAGFNRLLALNPQEIQVGILKRLRGTPIVRHTDEWKMKYSPHPPYEILSNTLIDFNTMQRISRFSRYWDLYSNSGNFSETLPLLLNSEKDSFGAFLKYSDWLYAKCGKRHAIALDKLKNYLKEYLLEMQISKVDTIDKTLKIDLIRCSKSKSSKGQFNNMRSPAERQLKHISIN